MRTFYGYPIPDDAHPTRPWWILATMSIGYGYRRTDGRTVVEVTEMAAIDRAHPLPAPPPMCGMVWRWPDGSESMIIARRADGHYLVHRGLALANTYHSPGHWPPPDAVLVAGPGSPWAPPEYEPEEVTP